MSESSSEEGGSVKEAPKLTIRFNVPEGSGIKQFWFVVFELAYIAVFVMASVAIHLFGFLKTDEDVVTIHHKIHKEVIAQQERRFMSQKKENFLGGNSLH